MKQKYALVTGAAKGIGKATALYLNQLGFHVFAGVRREEDGAALLELAPLRLTPVLLDVTNQEQIARAVETVSGVVGEQGLDALVNNAGIAVGCPIEFIPLDDLRHQFEVNLFGQVAVTQAFIPLLRQAKGRIVNISSIAGRLTTPLTGAYSASKFGMEAITNALRQELHPWGIDAISIQPGAIATPIWETSNAYANRLREKLPERAQELYGKLIAGMQKRTKNLGETATPAEEVAEVVGKALLAPRPRASYTVGNDARFAAAVLLKLPARLRERIIRQAR